MGGGGGGGGGEERGWDDRVTRNDLVAKRNYLFLTSMDKQGQDKSLSRSL